MLKKDKKQNIYSTNLQIKFYQSIVVLNRILITQVNISIALTYIPSM